MEITSLIRFDPPRCLSRRLVSHRRPFLGGDLPLVGSYERFGGNQPGPWLFWILAVPSLVGPIGIGVATLTIGYGAIAGMLRGARPSWPWCSPDDAPGRWRW